MKDKELLFFFGDTNCSTAIAAVPTLAALAERVGIDFETYMCTRPLSWGGQTLPFTGHMHGESFCYLANFYKKIYFVSLTNFRSYQFRREILAWGGEQISCHQESEIIEFYAEVFARFNQPLPVKAAVIPDPPENVEHISENSAFLTPYFYYDLYKGGYLGLTVSAFNRHAEELTRLGVTSVVTCCCRVDGEFPVTELYPWSPTAGYAEITRQIAERHWKEAAGLVFGDGNLMVRWTAYFLRENKIPLYQPFHWEEFVPVIAEYSQKIGNPLIVGCQNVYPHNTDAVMAEFAKYGMFFDLLGTDPRLGFSIQKKHPLPIDWLADIPAPWEEEYSDDFLCQKIEENALPVCFLLYAADLGHLPVLPRVLDLMSQNGNRAGLAFPANWYDYHPELLEQLYIPLAEGGVFPQLEPMISSGGLVVACEAEGMIAPETLTSLLTSARKKIASHVGEHLVPVGYYPWQDASPFYCRNSGKPQFEAVAKAGFEYYVSYLDSAKPGKILYESHGMTVLNQQIPQWFPGAGVAEEVLAGLERNEPFRTDWATIAFDMPFFGLSPVYLNGKALHERFNGKVMGMQTIAEAMEYVRNGGESKRLFMLKPHELYRYVHLLKKEGCCI